MGDIILYILFRLFSWYLISGVIFSILSFLYMFTLNREKNFKLYDYLYMILFYPLIIYFIIRDFYDE